MWHVSNQRSPGHHPAMCTTALCQQRSIQINEMKSWFHIMLLMYVDTGAMMSPVKCPLNKWQARNMYSNFTLYPKKLSITALQPKWWPQSLLPGEAGRAGLLLDAGCDAVMVTGSWADVFLCFVWFPLFLSCRVPMASRQGGQSRQYRGQHSCIM